MKIGAFKLNFEGWGSKGNQDHPGCGKGMSKSSGQGSACEIWEGDQSDVNHKVRGVFSFWHTAPGRIPKSVLLFEESTESEMITGTSESVTKLFRKHHCFWEV